MLAENDRISIQRASARSGSSFHLLSINMQHPWQEREKETENKSETDIKKRDDEEEAERKCF